VMPSSRIPFSLARCCSNLSNYIVTCYGGTILLAAEPQFRQLGRNELGDESVFNASPAIVGGKLLLRSDQYLYCIGKTGA
jgi:outer membrane protein assembly factor BamB